MTIRISIFLSAILMSASMSHSAEITHGPLIGHVTSTSANIWARGSEPGEYTLLVTDATSKNEVTKVSASAELDNDLTLKWQVKGLTPGKQYAYKILQADRSIANDETMVFEVPLEDADLKTVKLAFGSCAWDVSHPQQPVWTAMQKARIDSVVLLGDTPYIDSTELAVLRQRYRDFWSIAELKSLIRHIPLYGVWDDHDFGSNDALGAIKGRENSRRAFIEYHANPSYGENDQGIYCRFRRGPVEVFLLDTRWFANTESSPANADRKTLIGRDQWSWLTKGLKESTAAFKILACGMIWNEAARPEKLDYWMAYPYEREGLFRFLKSEGISGVILIGGDIHRSRHLVHPTSERVGYDLHEFVSSPLAESVADYNNVPSPYLLYDEGLKDSYLLMTIDAAGDAAKVTAEFRSRDEVKHAVTIDSSDLRLTP